MCIYVFENGILFAREVFSSNSAFENENLLAKNVFPHRDTKPSQIFLGWSNFYFSTRASATTVSTCVVCSLRIQFFILDTVLRTQFIWF